ncbi:hypothetical protein SBADM41S_09671 [Streptomyces badius]
MVSEANSPAPIPVSRGLGNRRNARTTGGTLRTAYPVHGGTTRRGRGGRGLRRLPALRGTCPVLLHSTT